MKEKSDVLEQFSLDAVPLHPRVRRDRLRSTLGATCLTFCVSFVVAFGLLVPSGTKHFGVGVSAYLVHYTLLAAVSGLCFGLVGKLVPRVGIRRLVIIGGSITTISIFAMSLTTNLYLFYFFAVLSGVGWSSCTLVAATIIINGWHLHQRRGSVLGAVLAGNAVGGVLWGLVMPTVVQMYGWSGGMQLLAICALAMMVLPGVLLIKNPPVRTTQQDQTALTTSRLPSLRASGLRFAVALLVIGAFALALEGGSVQILPTLFADRGIDPVKAGVFVSLYAVGGIVTKPLFGFIYDRFGPRGASFAAWIAFMIGFPWLALTTSENSYYIIIPLISLALTTYTVMVPLIVSDAVAPEHFSNVFGKTMMIGSLGLAISTPMWGLLYDLTGDFTPALYAASVLGTLGMVLLLVGRHWGKKQTLKVASSEPVDVPVSAGASTH
ncbi:MFS transporter [Arthrobacter sp. MYb227]|uniref:MFS transporter n=1 Tax=Arthrobacter sp. MYb227 TaxID=1848601 RepID=UPI0015E3D968|nr:MFS transporter [Arthrobacter sp. MYb227]